MNVAHPGCVLRGIVAYGGGQGGWEGKVVAGGSEHLLA